MYDSYHETNIIPTTDHQIYLKIVSSLLPYLTFTIDSESNIEHKYNFYLICKEIVFKNDWK